MRRSRALVAFGGLVAVLAVGRASAHPTSVGRSHGVIAPRSSFVLQHVAGPELFSGATRAARMEHDGTSLLGSFLRPGAGGVVPSAGAACPPEMVEVDGEYCPIVTQTCIRWLDPETRLQCAEFDRPRAAEECPTRTQHKRFCVDRFEWPNEVSALPRVMTTWGEARAICEGAGKRLCSDTEWTLACEGPDRQPYPYGDGYVRDERACNIDQPHIDADPRRLFDAKTQGEELARLDQRESSGSRAACVSPYGVHDMVGNVDEWVSNESQFGKPYRSALKGGYWGPVRTRCRPMTTAHDEVFRYYQIGFRCCGEVAPTPGPARPLEPLTRLARRPMAG